MRDFLYVFQLPLLLCGSHSMTDIWLTLWGVCVRACVRACVQGNNGINSSVAMEHHPTWRCASFSYVCVWRETADSETLAKWLRWTTARLEREFEMKALKMGCTGGFFFWRILEKGRRNSFRDFDREKRIKSRRRWNIWWVYERDCRFFELRFHLCHPLPWRFSF